MRWPAAALLALALPVQAEEVAGTGWLGTCVDDACEVIVNDTIHFVLGGEGTPTDIMLALYEQPLGVSPVSLAGRVLRPEGLPPELVLSALEFLPETEAARMINAAQGVWVPRDAGLLHRLTLKGLRWIERQDGRQKAQHRIAPAETCADGAAQGGPVLSLRPLWEPGPEVECWRITGASKTELHLTRLSPDRREVVFDRWRN